MKYKVGDKVLIRQWEDMVKHLDDEHDHRMNGFMQNICGNIYEINDVSNDMYFFNLGNDCIGVAERLIERKVTGMTKSDLEDGVVCKLRNGDTYVVFGDKLRGLDKYLRINEYHDDLTITIVNHDLDVMEMYYTCGSTLIDMLDIRLYGTMIWKRDDVKEMTVAEIEKILGYPVKIVKE